MSDQVNNLVHFLRAAETKFDMALSSDLSRALNTGRIIAENNPTLDPDTIQTWAVLRERCFGEFEGGAASKMTEVFREKDKGQLMDWGPAGGETGHQFRARAREYLLLCDF